MAPSPLAHHFYTLACNNAWANHRLLTACCKLSQADFVATRTSFFPSIKATLNHNLTVDWFYVDAIGRGLRGEPANRDIRRFFEPEEPIATCAALATEQRAVDRRLIEACASLTEGQLTQPSASACGGTRRNRTLRRDDLARRAEAGLTQSLPMSAIGGVLRPTRR